MSRGVIELDGKWEEIVQHSHELAGRHIHLIAEPPAADIQNQAPRRTLDLLDEWDRNPLTADEITALDDFEEFNRTHPFSLTRDSIK